MYRSDIPSSPEKSPDIKMFLHSKWPVVTNVIIAEALSPSPKDACALFLESVFIRVGGSLEQWGRKALCYQESGTASIGLPCWMKCCIYLQDDMMNHVKGTINQLIKMDKWLNKVMHWQIWGEEIATSSDSSHV